MLPRPVIDHHWSPRPGVVDTQGPTVYSDGRIGHQTFPPRGTSYPGAYSSNSPLRPQTNGPIVAPEVSSGDDVQRSFRGMVVEDDRVSPAGPHIHQQNFAPEPLFPSFFQVHSTPYNPYPAPPEYGKYYLTPVPEPFTNYSFPYEGFRHHPNQPHYPMSQLNHMVPNNSFPHPNANTKYPGLSLMSGVISENSHPIPQMMGMGFPGESSSQVFYPSPPHMMLSPHAHHIYPVRHTDVAPFVGNHGGQQKLSPAHSNTFVVRQQPQAMNPSPEMRQVSMGQLGLSPQHVGVRQPRRVSGSSERSALLEDFRSNRERAWELKDILGYITEFSGDQHGSRFIQQQLEIATEEERHAVFTEFYPLSTNQLMRDVFGNYVIQKFFDLGTKAQKDALAGMVEKHAIELSLHIYGCRVVQKAIDCITGEQQTSIINRLEQDVLTCIKDAHGNHVIQKIVEAVVPNRLTFLPYICENIHDLATHPYGCRVLQRCLEHLPQEITRPLRDAVHCYTLKLMEDQYGNYVIQFIIERGQEIDRVMTISKIRGNLVKLAQHKYASNVCEKAIRLTDPDTRRALINEIMTPPYPDMGNPISIMIQDCYANYVLQCALNNVEDEQAEELYSQVRSLVAIVRKSTTTHNRPLVAIERLVERPSRRSLPNQ